jgi:hypothetical protein
LTFIPSSVSSMSDISSATSSDQRNAPAKQQQQCAIEENLQPGASSVGGNGEQRSAVTGAFLDLAAPRVRRMPRTALTLVVRRVVKRFAYPLTDPRQFTILQSALSAECGSVIETQCCNSRCGALCKLAANFVWATLAEGRDQSTKTGGSSLFWTIGGLSKTDRRRLDIP